jgi:hypothetical protein
MEMRDKLFGAWAEYDHATDTVALDVGALVRRLLLFEQLTLQSTRLREIPQLLAALGYDGVKELLDSGAVRIYCDAVTVAQIGQSDVLESRVKKGLLPRGSYSFSQVIPHDRKEYISGCFASVESDFNLPDRKRIRLKRLVAQSLTRPLVDGNATIAGLEQDLMTNAPVVVESIAQVLARRLATKVSTRDFELRIDRLDDRDFRAETNIGPQFNLDESDVHEIVERGLLGVGGLNQRIEQMKAFDSLTGFEESELPLFESKLDFLAAQLDPSVQERRLNRVLTIAELPLPGAQAQDIDVGRLLEIRESDACREMRAWLRSVDGQTDVELHDSFHKVREQLSRMFHGTTGRVARMAFGTGLGFVPVVGAVAGAAYGGLDQFLLENVVPQPGPFSFLSREYPSIFRPDEVLMSGAAVRQ